MKSSVKTQISPQIFIEFCNSKMFQESVLNVTQNEELEKKRMKKATRVLLEKQQEQFQQFASQLSQNLNNFKKKVEKKQGAICQRILDLKNELKEMRSLLDLQQGKELSPIQRKNTVSQIQETRKKNQEKSQFTEFSHMNSKLTPQFECSCNLEKLWGKVEKLHSRVVQMEKSVE